MVFRERQTILKPVGLVTQPNAYGVYVDGALKRADNVTLRNPGELVQMPGSQNTVSIAVANGIIPKLVPLDDGHVVAVAGTGSSARPYADGTVYSFQFSGFSNPMIGFSATSTRICGARLAERLTLNAPTCCIVTDSMSPTVAGDRVFRRAGVPQVQMHGPLWINPGTIPQGIAVGYRACWRRDFADGYFLRSVPSPVLVFGNNTGLTQTVSFLVVLLNAGPQPGDVLEIYRTDGFPITALPAIPSVGDTLKRIAAHAVTSAEIAAVNYLFSDTQEFVPGTTTTPGDELYTNPYQETEIYANRQPPVAQALATFKGYQFFGGTTDRALVRFTAAGGFGNQIQAVLLGVPVGNFKANAIGEREITATRTSGSPTITGVSAADLVGIKVGQQLSATKISGFPTSTAIVSINSGAGTITFAANATSSSGGPVVQYISDVIQIVGSATFQFESLPRLVDGLAAMSPPFEVTIDRQAGYLGPNAASYVVGAAVQIESALPGESIFTTLAVRATNGANYTPQLPEFTATAQTFSNTTLRNHLVWSKEQQPEHVPTPHETFVGSGEIVALNPTRDALWIWCTDGLYRLSGTAGSDGLGWGLDVVSTTLILAAPQASCVLGESVYGYTNQGFVGVDSAGNVDYLSAQKIGDILPGAQYDAARVTVCEANETDDEVLLALGENSGLTSHVIWVYNVKQRGWTRISTTGAAFRFVTAIAMQRSTASGEPRALFATSPGGGASPSYSGWNGPTFLECAAEYQPVYGDDPLSLKQYIWCDFIFASGSNGKTLVPLYNSATNGLVTVTDFQNSGYARSGVPRSVAVAHSISAGFEQLSGAVQSRFQGLSFALNTRTNQSKKR